jgi:hypothetical protein
MRLQSLSHFPGNALHRAAPDAALSSYFQHALPGPQLTLDPFFQSRINPRPAKLLIGFYRQLKSGVDPLADDAAPELRKSARHLKHELSGLAWWCRFLLVEVQIAGQPQLRRCGV